jgi:2-polyprenyl-3-methyl-5-hydroxy-6-metoxy-1,4-benzoquinol methylase
VNPSRLIPFVALVVASCASAAARRTESAPAHTHGDRVPHHVSAREYAARLDEPSRAEWQMPDRVVSASGVTAGMRVADLGTGSGYFVPALSSAVGANGAVLGEDIDAALLDIAREHAAAGHLTNVTFRQGTPDDPGLEPASYDRVFVVDAYHHIENRPAFLAHVRAALRPGTGRFVVVDFRDGDLPVGPPPGHKLPRAQVERELRENGFAIEREETFLPYQYLLVLAPSQ